MSKWLMASNVQPGIVFRDIVYINKRRCTYIAIYVTRHKAEDLVSRGVPPYMNDS